MNTNQAISRAIALWPSLKAFATALGVPYQTVQQWMRNGVPAAYCPKIEKLTDGRIKCEELNTSVDWAYVRGTVQLEVGHQCDAPATVANSKGAAA